MQAKSALAQAPATAGDIVEAERTGADAPLPFHSKLSYGIGQYAEGITQSSMASLMFFYYSQVLGLPASLVGLGLLLAGVTDGVLDAFVGLWSDSTKSRLGRRHPYLYASAVPFGLTLIFVYMPPAWLSGTALFVWLFVGAFSVRAALTFFVIPHWALGAEMTKNFHERTTVVAYRIFFSFVGSASVYFASVFIFRTVGGHDALLDPAPYRILGLLLGGLCMAVILISAWGTQSLIPRLPQRSASDQRATFRGIIAETAGLFRNRSFRIFFLASNILALGLIQARVLELYMGKYFWRFSNSETLLLPGLSILGFAGGTLFWAAISRRIGKKAAYITGVLGYSFGMVMLPMLKILGVLPDAESSLYFPVIAALSFTSQLFASAAGVIAGSVLADVAEDYQRQTGKNKAGLIAGSLVFCNKAMGGVAQLLAGLVLGFIGLEARMPVDLVPKSMSVELALFFSFIAGVCGIGFALVFRRYTLGGKSRTH